MKTYLFSLIALLALALVLPACGEEMTLAQVIAGKDMPLALQMKDLSTGWVRMQVSNLIGVSEMTHMFSSMMGSQLSGVFFTKGRTITLDGVKYLVAYSIPRRPPNSEAMRDGPQTPAPVTADSELSLSLLSMATLGSLLDIRPFDLTREIAGGKEAEKVIAAAQEKTRMEESMNNLRQLAITAQLFAQDNDETLPTEKQFTAEAHLAPQVLVVPGTQDKYLYNITLGGKGLGDFKNPTVIVMFYEPKQRQDGTRCAAFLDGHVENLADARWQDVKKQSGIQ